MITDFDAPPVPPLPCAKPSGSSPIGNSSMQQPHEKQKLRVNVATRSQGSAEQHERGESPTSPALSNASTSYSASLYSSAKYKRKLENMHVPVPKINNTDSCSIFSAAPSIAPSTTSSATCVHTLPKSHTAKNLPSPDEAVMAKASWLSEDEDNKAEPLKKKTTPLYDQNSRDVASPNAWDSESSQYQSANNEYSPRDKRREQAATRPRRESPDRPVRGEHTRQALNHQPSQHYPTESNSRQYHRHQQDMHYHTPRDQSYYSSQAPATHQYQHQHQHQHQYRPPRLQSREHLDHH
ncbi:hypothetical protein BGW42_008487 [Actinomortierella wolfii]|nr:hypothetical protein BGW42_008487 [Actinomortierella wolfii]